MNTFLCTDILWETLASTDPSPYWFHKQSVGDVLDNTVDLGYKTDELSVSSLFLVQHLGKVPHSCDSSFRKMLSL